MHFGMVTKPFSFPQCLILRSTVYIMSQNTIDSYLNFNSTYLCFTYQIFSLKEDQGYCIFMKQVSYGIYDDILTK